mmetsp:Transcript_29999/g.88963  ORF Transcript_29999/g.88963 Transcript_29999/m.88963 type:complete len:232 (-) Transcript_29999:692-1387(-)
MAYRFLHFSTLMSVARCSKRSPAPASITRLLWSDAICARAICRAIDVSSDTYSITTLKSGRGNCASCGVLAHTECSSVSLSFKSFTKSTCSAVRGKPSTSTPHSGDEHAFTSSASSSIFPTTLSGIMSPRAMISRLSGWFFSRSDMETHTSRPRVCRMWFWLAPLPDPGAPFSHTTSRGTWICRSQNFSSKRFQQDVKITCDTLDTSDVAGSARSGPVMGLRGPGDTLSMS